MKYAFKTSLELEGIQIGNTGKSGKEYSSRSSVEPTGYGLIVRPQQHWQANLFNEPARAGGDLHAELAQARWGLVPNEFSSPREADRYELWTNRAERVRFSRSVYRAFLETRCLVPVELGSLEGTTVMRTDGTVLEGTTVMRTDGTVLTALETLAMCSRTVLLAGIWTRFDRPRLRLESYSIITRLHDVSQGLRSVIMLSSSEAKLWLNPDSSETMLEGIVGVRTQASRREARGSRRTKPDGSICEAYLAQVQASG
jgi:putative SOS response-associated peptidase YedK